MHDALKGKGKEVVYRIGSSLFVQSFTIIFIDREEINHEKIAVR
jgi:hypothetical protein